jgi:hypothetical protein
MRRAARGVRRGRLGPWESAGCRSLGSALLAGLFWRRHRARPSGARGTIVSNAPWWRHGHFGAVGDSGRAKGEERKFGKLEAEIGWRHRLPMA